MKKILAILLTLALLLSLAACGAANPNVGVYEAISCDALGISMDCEGEWIELKNNGKGKLSLMGDEFGCTWELEGEKLTVTNQGDEFRGTLRNGVITLDYGGMVYVYVMQPIENKDGTVRGHVHAWTEAGCEQGKTCRDCGATEGEALGHDTLPANYQMASFCRRCGTFFGEKLQPDMEKYGITEFMELGVPYSFTALTNYDETLSTTGEMMITDYEIFTSAEGYPEKEGYEWRVITGYFRFWDYNARHLGYNVDYCYEDYYSIDLSDEYLEYVEEEDGYVSRLSYNGQEMPYYVHEEWQPSGWHYNEETGRKESTGNFVRAWQVPVGYDGIVAGFYNNAAVVWEERHIYEIYDPEMFRLFRLD